MPGGLFSLAKLHAITLRESANDGSDFTNPDADFRRLFLGEDGLLHLRDSAGTVTDIGGGTPDAHATSHENGGSDEIDVTGLVGAGGTPAFVGAKVYNSGTQSISASSLTALTFDSEEWDTDGFHSTSVNTSRMTIPSGKDGKYLVVAGTRVPGAGWSLGVAVNGTRVRNQTNAVGNGADSDIQTTAIVDVVATNYIEVHVNDPTGGNVGHASAAVAQSHLDIVWLGA